jgi:hypothetical protein
MSSAALARPLHHGAESILLTGRSTTEPPADPRTARSSASAACAALSAGAHPRPTISSDEVIPGRDRGCPHLDHRLACARPAGSGSDSERTAPPNWSIPAVFTSSPRRPELPTASGLLVRCVGSPIGEAQDSTIHEVHDHTGTQSPIFSLADGMFTQVKLRQTGGTAIATGPFERPRVLLVPPVDREEES